MKGFKIKRGLSGHGLVALRVFKRGQRVIEYTGELIDDAEADRRSNRYLFEVRKNVNIDGSTRRNLARYVNHSCKPNCTDRIVGDKVFYEAKRRIEPGEELTVDYGQDYFNFWIAPYGCKCGAEKHRKSPRKAKKKKTPT